MTEHIVAMVAGKVKPFAEGPERDLFAISIIQNGHYFELLGTDERLQSFKEFGTISR